MYVIVYRTVDTGSGTEVLYDEYREIRGLSFRPETDITGDTLPINQFSCDIITTDVVEEGDYIDLMDDRDRLWAHYWRSKTVRVDTKTVRVTASSPLYLLEYVEMEETVYEAATAQSVVSAIFTAAGASGIYTLHASLRNKTVSGYCPRQTCRERLTWVLFIIGAYVRDVGESTAKLVPLDLSTTIIPPEKTFLRPSIETGDIVTAVTVVAYTFTRAASEEDWRNDSTSYRFPLPWVATETEMTLVNPSIPPGTPPNVKRVDELYLVNADNLSEVISRVAPLWFNPTTVTLDCINDRSKQPGDLVTAYLDTERMVRGYIQSCDFKFGLRARSTLKLGGVDGVETASLTVNYRYNGRRIGFRKYVLPLDYAFRIKNPYIDRNAGGHRYIYRPLTEYAEGTLDNATNVVNVDYEVALDLYQGVLHIISVDEISTSTDASGNVIGVIA